MSRDDAAAIIRRWMRAGDTIDDSSILGAADELAAALAETGWRSMDEMPEFDHRPSRQFILIEGFKEHSGALWHRSWAGEAFIRKPDDLDGVLEYRRSDMERMMRDGDMDVIERVAAWMPAVFPPPPPAEEPGR